MWPQWLKSPNKVLSKSKSPSKFSSSSFKDVQSLFKEEFEPLPESELHHPKKLPIFHRVRRSKSLIPTWSHHNATPPIPLLSSQPPSITLPNANQRIVLYYTSLRVIRKTFAECSAVRSIFHGFRVPLDERDISMDSSFLQELQEIMGSKNWTPPRVFIGGRYIGGAEEIGRLDETDELKKLIGRLPVVEPSGCDLCGGHRFLLCEQCNGSHKVYSEKCGFRSCWACNVNGLIRCSSC